MTDSVPVFSVQVCLNRIESVLEMHGGSKSNAFQYLQFHWVWQDPQNLKITFANIAIFLLIAIWG